MMTGYEGIIMEATGCSPTDVNEIEEIMRGVIFHSTLDWQTREELQEGARMAFAVLQETIRRQDSDGRFPRA